MRLGAVEYLAGAAGVGLLVAAIGNRNPLDIVREALTGQATGVRPLAQPRRVDTSSLAGIAAASAGPTTSGDLANPTGVPPLAAIGQGGHRLHTAAVEPFRRWEALYGRRIILTDSYRDYATQAAGHRDDPNRFADPDKSAHTDGLAVDVNLGATTNGQSVAGMPLYDKLAATGAAAGWVSYGAGRQGTDTWHFSYGSVR